MHGEALFNQGELNKARELLIKKHESQNTSIPITEVLPVLERYFQPDVLSANELLMPRCYLYSQRHFLCLFWGVDPQVADVHQLTVELTYLNGIAVLDPHNPARSEQ